jgi:stage III sporulation protein AH
VVSMVINRKKAGWVAAVLLLAVACCWWEVWSVSGRSTGIVAQKTVKQTVTTKSSSDSGEDFFVESRLARDRINSRQIAYDQEIADNSSSNDTMRQQAQQDIMKLVQRMGNETELERLIMARGYTDAVVVIQDQVATVIIKERVLQPEEVAKIIDLVSRGTGLDNSQITVIPKP